MRVYLCAVKLLDEPFACGITDGGFGAVVTEPHEVDAAVVEFASTAPCRRCNTAPLCFTRGFKLEPGELFLVTDMAGWLVGHTGSIDRCGWRPSQNFAQVRLCRPFDHAWIATPSQHCTGTTRL